MTLRAIFLFALWQALPAAGGSSHTPPPVQPATSFAAVEVHEDEKVAIAAEPYDIRLIVTNNSNRPINLTEARILFITAAGAKIQVAEPEDVERLMTRKEREGGQIPLPGALPNIKLKPVAGIGEIEKDFDTFEYRALVVEPHTTRAGFLFYDVSGLDHPLEGAKLHLHKLRDADGNELFYFEIPLDKYLKSKSSQMN